MTRHSAALCLVAAFGELGCRQVLGVGDYGVGDTSFQGKHDGFRYSSESCRDCVDTSCGELAGECAQDPACAARGQCLARCASSDSQYSQCRGTCNLSVPDSPAMRALVACEANACETCGASRAVLGGGSCDACLLSNQLCELDTFSKNLDALNLAACDPEGCAGAPNCDCSAYKAGIDARKTVANCASGACGRFCNPTRADPDWSCLGHVQWPGLSNSQRGADASATSSRGLLLQIRPVNISQQSTKNANLSVSACGPRDLSCATPLVSSATDLTGWVSLDLPDPGSDPWFLDHLKVTDPNSDLSALLYTFPPPRDSPAFRSIRILPKGIANANAFDLSIDPHWESKGGIAFSVVSCNGKPAEGVTVSSSPGGDVYYSDTGPSVLGRKWTYPSGLGVLANVEPSHPTTTLKAVRSETGEVIFEQEIVVEQGLITSVPIVPSPIE